MGLGEERTYSVIAHGLETLTYPLLCVQVSEQQVQDDEEYQTQEERPFYDDAGLQLSWSVLGRSRNALQNDRCRMRSAGVPSYTKTERNSCSRR